MSQPDIAIIGGGIIGSALAYFLARSGRAGAIVVLEADLDYQRATTPTGAGGIRQLFSLPENIWMSQHSLQFYREFAETMALDGTTADIDFEQRGYLFVVVESGTKQLEANHRLQVSQGVNAQLLTRAELQARFPSLGLDDIALGCFSPDDGTITTTKALQGFRRQAEALGVTYRQARVAGLEFANGRVQSAMLDGGETVRAKAFACAAGAWSQEVVAMAGLPLPVVPLCRVKHYWECDSVTEPLPLVKDESGMFFRPQGAGFVGGRPSWEIQPGFAFQSENSAIREYFEGYFERGVRPLISKRLPAFRTARCPQSWTGHYAQNTLDGNMILGSLGESAENLYVACGFSGHGVMHAPAVGLALSELMLSGRYETMDLARMGYQRVRDNAPYPEVGII